MKPYGREKNIHGAKWKKDVHPRPKRKWENWWESMCNLIPRTTMKQKWKKHEEDI